MPAARLVLVAVFAIACQQAAAQTAATPALEVQRLAPHLVALAGSQANFQSLVNGLAQGTPVQLASVLPDGSTQVVSFTPGAPLTSVQIVQALESARQQLIGLGIGSPTGEQLALALTGGTVPTPLGGSTLVGTLGSQSPPSPAAQIQSRTAAAGGTASGAVSVQTLPATPRINTSDSSIPAGATSRSPLPAPTSTTPPLAVTPTPAPASTPAPTAPAPVAPTQARPTPGAR